MTLLVTNLNCDEFKRFFVFKLMFVYNCIIYCEMKNEVNAVILSGKFKLCSLAELFVMYFFKFFEILIAHVHRCRMFQIVTSASYWPPHLCRGLTLLPLLMTQNFRRYSWLAIPFIVRWTKRLEFSGLWWLLWLYTTYLTLTIHDHSRCCLLRFRQIFRWSCFPFNIYIFSS